MNLLNGKQVAETWEARLRDAAEAFRRDVGGVPALAVCLVGQDPASQIYVRKKAETTRRLGMKSFELQLPEDTSTTVLLEQIHRLNEDPQIHGILVQLPLPKQIQAETVLASIHPLKDVDGFHPENVGLLHLGTPRFVPCTPLGMMKILEAYKISPKGLHAVVVGRSNIVGKPMAALLLQAHATVTICHSQTHNLKEILREADLIVAAIGKPKMITAQHLKSGAIVLDVGINRGPDGKLCGDVDFESAKEIAGFLTPVPGGVGPMTITGLMMNTMMAANLQRGKAWKI